jgi:hypothetical protein
MKNNLSKIVKICVVISALMYGNGVRLNAAALSINNKDGRTLLHAAADTGDVQKMQALLDGGFDINTLAWRGCLAYTPLDAAFWMACENCELNRAGTYECSSCRMTPQVIRGIKFLIIHGGKPALPDHQESYQEYLEDPEVCAGIQERAVTKFFMPVAVSLFVRK